MSAPSESLGRFFNGKKILILGFGREGRSTLSMIKKTAPDAEVAVADMSAVDPGDPGIKVYSGERYMDALADGFDVVMKTPGIAFLDVTVPDGTLVTCQNDLFLRFRSCRAVGVTGTKGKTTTSTLIYRILREAGVDARLFGNIGVPPFEELDAPESCVAVIEMSSHQLEFTRTSPDVAVLTNIYEEHLDHYATGFAGYADAKLNIARYQTSDGVFIYNGDEFADGFPRPLETRAKKVPVRSTDALPVPEDFYNPHLRGAHNRFDMLIASRAAAVFGAGDDAAARAFAAFEGIEHRMEYVGRVRGIDFYNDAIATIPMAALSAMDAIPETATLIVGGMDRGIDYKPLIDGLLDRKPVNLICMPDTGYTIGDTLKAAGYAGNIIRAADMQAAVDAAFDVTPEGKVCLLSPAAASYNVYKNFEYKGKDFKEKVLGHG
ncbi:MAG: UDP-N-acetylmuramoyl-L-alanine--D-glutamate ligase [Clostridia bacterium]|nr:UDP-N-acetylmuramoyl-L-alanine--D-glutamate ligase [Clostridia bacterium]